MEKRWVVRRSEPVKEVLLIEGRVYPGRAQGTIGLRIQKRRDIKKYRRTRTRPEIGTIGWELAFRPEEHRGREAYAVFVTDPPYSLLDCDSNIGTMEKRARLTVDLHNGAARNRFTHSRRCRGEVVRVTRVLRGDGINAWKRKCCIQRRGASSQSRHSNPTTIRVKGDVSGGTALPGHSGGEREWSALSNLRRTC